MRPERITALLLRKLALVSVLLGLPGVVLRMGFSNVHFSPRDTPNTVEHDT